MPVGLAGDAGESLVRRAVARAGVLTVLAMIREDYVMRMVKQFADAIARMLGLRQRGEHQAALDEAGRLYEDLFAIPREATDRVDTPTVASLLGRPDKIRAAAMLFWEEGHIYKAKVGPLTAFARYRRAHELFLEARAIDPTEDDDSALLELSRDAPARAAAPARIASSAVSGQKVAAPRRGLPRCQGPEPAARVPQ
jgi:hypothetical protein